MGEVREREGRYERRGRKFEKFADFMMDRPNTNGNTAPYIGFHENGPFLSGPRGQTQNLTRDNLRTVATRPSGWPMMPR